ncbi:hypothetical protein V8F06_011456 [Rhypophila decipiens]
MDPPSNNDDTTTTEYDSGGSEGVDYAYEGKQVAALRRGSIESSASQRKIRKDNRSPRRKTSPPRAAKARTTPPTTTTTRCVCGGGAGGRARESDGDSDATVSTDRTSSESDTEDEDGPGKRLSRPRRRRASGLRGGGGDSDDVEEDRRHCDGRCCDRRKKTRKNSTTTNASKKSAAAKKTPYIEEYPEEIRPVVLLKEHKLPRGSFSNSTTTDSNAKRLLRGTEDHAQMSSSLGKIQSMGKRPPWHSSSSAAVREEGQHHEQQQHSSHSSEKQQQHRRRRRNHAGHGQQHGATKPPRHEGERPSSSSDFDSDSASDSSPAQRDRDMVRDRDRRPSMVRRNSRQQAERGAEMMPSAVAARSSAARNHSSSPKYSSSWPLQQRGGDASSSYDRDYSRRHQHHRIITQEPEQIDLDPLRGGGGGGYESGDESDDIFTGEFEFDETTHRRLPRRPPSPPPAHHHHHRQPHPHRAEHVLHRQPSAQLRSLREQPREEEYTDEEPRRRPPGQGRSVKPPRPPVARTVVTNRPSMGALDQGIDIDRAGTYAAEPCDIWRGRPEDWESPYSGESSDHEEEDDYDYQYRSSGEGAGGGYGSRHGGIGYDTMMLLEGGRRQRGSAYGYERCSSPQLLPPRRSGDLRSVFSLGFSRGRNLSPAPTTFSGRRSSRAWDAADEHGGGMLLEPPAPSVRGGGGGGRRATRAPSRAPTERSRWTVMAPPAFEDRHHQHAYPYGEEYGYGYGGYGYPYYGENDYGVPYSPPPAPEEEETFDADGYYSYGGSGYGPSIRVQAPSPPAGGSGLTAPPPLRRGYRGMPTAMTEEEEMEYGYYGRASGGLLSPVPTRTAAARFNFDKSWSELSRLLL